MTGERYMLVITAIPDSRTATQRLKCLLKTLLRSHGFRCDELRPALHDEPSEPPDGSELARDGTERRASSENPRER